MSSFSDELRGQLAPSHINDFLRKIGGKAPYGNALYRLVRCESRFNKVFGQFTDWDDNAELDDRGGIARDEQGNWNVNGTPIRTVEESRWVEVYPGKVGWVLERWYPAHMFGARQEWEAESLLGAYPEQGRYVDCTNVLPDIPSLSTLEKLVQAIEYKISNKRGTAEARILQRAKEIDAALQARADKKKALMADMFADRSTLKLSSSLAASRYKNRLAERAGIRSHVGS